MCIRDSSKVSTSEITEYRSEMNANLLKLQSDVQSRDQQIDALKAKLEALLQQQPQAEAGSPSGSQATEELVAMLRQRIDQLEAEKQRSAAEDQKQNALIEQLSARDAKSQTQIQSLQQKLEASDRRYSGLQRKLDAVLEKLGLSKQHDSKR